MKHMVMLLIENASFIAIFLLCIYGAMSVRKHTEDVPGADLLLIGFLLYSAYGMLSWGVPGFNGSFMNTWTKIAVLDGKSMMYFAAQASRLSLILILVGIFKVGRGLKA